MRAPRTPQWLGILADHLEDLSEGAHERGERIFGEACARVAAAVRVGVISCPRTLASYCKRFLTVRTGMMVLALSSAAVEISEEMDAERQRVAAEAETADIT